MVIFSTVTSASEIPPAKTPGFPVLSVEELR